MNGDLRYLENALRRTFDQLVKEDVVANAVAIIETGIEDFSKATRGQKGVVARIADSLEIRAAPSKETENENN